MATQIKITQLTDIGSANLSVTTLLPVVNMAGVPTTQKTTLGNLANVILSQSGGNYAPVATANIAYSVANAAQPNITSVGTLTNVVVSGNATVNGNITSNGTAYVGNLSTTGLASITTLTVGATANLGAVANVTITGGSNGQVLTTNGSNVLSWTTVSSGNSSYGDSNVVSLMAAFGSNTITTTGNISGGNLVTGGQVVASGNVSSGTGLSTGGFLSVDGNTDLHNTTVTGNLSATGNITANNLGNIVSVNLTGSNSNVLYGNGVFAPATGGNSTYGDSNVVSLLSAFGSNTITTTGNVTVGNIIGNGQALTGIAGANVSGFVPNANVANTAFAVAAANVSGLGNIATVNLTGSNANVLYGNGVFAAVAGGNANTGNVTFNDINIIGTGNLKLQPDSANASAYLDIYLTGGPDIHIAGNGETVILGTDDYANVAVNIDGNVSIQAGNVSGTQTWNFGTDGTLTFPDGGGIYNNGSTQFYGAPNSQVSVSDYDGYNQFFSYPGNGAGQGAFIQSSPDLTIINTWQFGVDGNITLPQGSQISETANTSVNITANANTWAFGVDGNLTIPGSLINDTSIVLSAPAVFNICTIATAGSGYNTGSSLKATTGGSGSGMTVGIGYGLSNQLTSVNVVNPGTGYVNGDVITVSEGTGGTFVLTKYNQSANQTNNNTIQTDFTFANSTVTLPIYGEMATDASMTLTTNLANAGNTSSWIFGDDGKLTFPGTPRIDTDANNFEVQAAEAINFEANTVVNIYTDAGNNAYQWQFGDDGNLTLPGNTFAVNYANGTQVSIGGGGNTGNVTFDNNIVIGTGDEFGGDGLFLAPGNASIANSAVQYLRVRGGDYPTHIHLDTGNNQYYDQYFGADGRYVKLEANGNVVINADDYLGNSATWTLTTDGNLILAGGNSVIQSIANSSLDPTLPNVSTMVLTPDPGYSTQSLVLDPTAPGHIHLRAPGANIDEPNANIFLGGEESSFEVGYYNGSAPNLFIHSNNNTWMFDIDGNITFPRDGSNISTDPYLKILGGPSPQILSEDASLAGPANLAIVTDYLNLSGSTGNRIAIYADNGEIGTEANMVLYTNLANPGNIVSWKLDTTGNLTLPGNLVIAGNANVFGIDASLIQQTDGLPIVISSSGANGAVATYWVEDYANASTSNIAAVYVRPTVGANIVRIAVGQNGGNAGPNLWDFGTDGNLTLPTNGHIIVSGGIVGGGASPAPYISGFDSIGSLEFTNGNSNVTVTANATSWTFGTNGNLTLPEGGIVTNNIPPVTFDILYQYDDLEWDGITVTFTNASSTYMLGVLALMQAGDPITLVGPGGPISTTVAIPYTGGSAGYFTVTEANSPIQISQFTLPNRLTSVNGVTLTTNAKNYLFTEAGVTQSPVLTVDTLPSGQYAVAGFRAFVSDANLAPVGNFGEIVGNSGSNTVCVWCDGTNWRIG
jgi:hypothetical protein